MPSISSSDEPSHLVGRLAAYIPLDHLTEKSLVNVATRWCEKHRFWHGPSHLLSLVEEIAATETGADKDALLIAALYHDAIYDPRSGTNEGDSAALLLKHAVKNDSTVIHRAAEIIVTSNWSAIPSSPLIRRFFDLDTRQLAAECPLNERLAYEMAIFREYQFASWATYREKRRIFLTEWAERYPDHKSGVSECLELLSGLSPRIAIYPGSFNPFHLGHLSILRQAEASFDKVIIAVGVNRQKAGAAEMLTHRESEIQSLLRFHEVVSVPGLVTDYIEELAHPVTIIRGVRDGTDLEAELRYSRFLNDLRPETNLLWISCRSELQHLSSSALRELEMIKPRASERYVPNRQGIYGLSDGEPIG